jgi:hypothetical protein
MKLKTLLGVIAGGCLLGSIALGETIQLTGTVSAVSTSQITLQSGKDVWLINRASTTRVTTGDLKVGSTVTVECDSPDAHKQELPHAPMSSPSSSPG